MRAIFDQVLGMSIAGSWVIVFVLAARLLLSKAPARYRYLLWGVVLLRLLCPLTPESPASLLPEREPVSVNAVSPAASPVLPSPAPDAGTSTQFTIYEAYEDLTVDAAPETPPVVTPPSLPELRRTLLRVLRVLWLPGAGVLLAGSLFSLIRLRRRLVGAAFLRDNIWLADHIGTAFVLGIVRPRIYLPSALPPEEQAYILLHEQTHLRRWDPIWKLLGFLALCVHWFNPLVWLALHFAERDMELSCDEAVLSQLGPEIRQAYAASLLRLSAGRQTGIAFGEGNTKGRILNVLRWKNPRLLVTLAAATAVILLTCGLLTDPVKAAELSALSGTYETAEIVGSKTGYPYPEDILLADGVLYTVSDSVAVWQGSFTEITLPVSGFDLSLSGSTLSESDWNRLERKNRRAWWLENYGYFQLLLAQRDGSLYLVSGSCGDSSAPRVNWAFRLRKKDDAAVLLPGDYYATGILYDAPEYSATYTPATMPVYTVDDIGSVTATDLFGDADIGHLEPVTLSSQNFDDLFHIKTPEETAMLQSIRERTERAWQLTAYEGSRFHYVLLMKGEDGGHTLLLASGYQKPGMQAFIRWLFRLSREPSQAVRAAFPEGEYAVAEIVYTAPLDSAELPPRLMSAYQVSRGGQEDGAAYTLYEQQVRQESLAPLGSLSPITLDSGNFDGLFPQTRQAALTVKRLRTGNAGAWQLTGSLEFYQLLMQDDGQLYLIKGVVADGVPYQAVWVYRLSARPGTIRTQGQLYQQAYDTLTAFRTPGFEAQTVSAFNRTLAPDDQRVGEVLELYGLVLEGLPADDPNAGFIGITLNASCGELYAKVFHEPNFFAINILDQRRLVEPENEEEVLLLSAQMPLYHFVFVTTAYIDYALDGTVTVGTRDTLLRKLEYGLREYVAAQDEEQLRRSDMETLLMEKAEEILRDTPHEGIQISIEFGNTEAISDD